MMRSFEYSGLPARVLFGQNTVRKLPEELDRLGAARPLIVTTPQQSSEGERLRDLLGKLECRVFTGAAMHTPVPVTEEATGIFLEHKADAVVAIGGGSTIGLGKAIALRTDALQLVLPTTYAGSEMTALIGETSEGRKITQKTLKVLPETVIYDVDYTLGLPAVMSVTSGVNAIAHAAEALYAENENPLLSLIAEEGISALFHALPKIIETPRDQSARSDALYGAWLCAVCLGSSGVALHHKLCHVLGGSFDLPHSETHSIVLPHALAFNLPACEHASARLKTATQSDNPSRSLYDVVQQSGAPVALKELGMPEAGIERAVAITLENPYWNPRPFQEDDIRAIVRAAWEGAPPA